VTSRTLLLTGANGFVGAHVAESAAAAGARVIAVGREPAPNDRLARFCDSYLSYDLADGWPGEASDGVDAVVHLAGLAAVGPSFEEPQRYIAVNSAIATHMFEHLLTQRRTAPRVVVVSSGAVYAPPDSPEDRISELSPTRASSPYAVAKLTVEAQAEYYGTRGLDTVVARPFNHIGPGQGSGFLVPDIATTVRRLPDGAPLRAGNLHTARDFTDVRDVARSYVLMALGHAPRERIYNVASGVARSGFDVLSVVCRELGRPVPEVVIDPAKMRPTDVPSITGDSSRLRSEFGWSPGISWERSITDFIHDTE